MDLLIIVNIKSSYDSWKAIFDSNTADRQEFADETRTRVAKADDNTAMVQLFDVDMQKMSKVLNNPNSTAAEVMAEHVVSREIYKVEKMTPPSA
ncbi:MAG: hypothetical protein VX260_03915 [Candidatus Neomarinimicrobiota bacterium]|nr:hypothetical protein [Candidatus Neomarinimicrobiota bacterium]